MIGRALVLFVFILSVKWGIWQPEPAGGLLGLAFFLAFISADEPFIKYVREVTKSEFTTKGDNDE